MTNGKEAEEQEEKTNENAKELLFEALKYNDVMELHGDAQLLKEVLNVGSCYPKLIEEFVMVLLLG